jgi:hypothetical protein
VTQIALRDGVGPPGDYPESESFKEKLLRPGLRSAELLAGAALTGGALLRRLGSNLSEILHTDFREHHF